MKLKRAKAYRKLMHQYEVTFGFRSPYQVLVDHEILEQSWRSKIQLVERLQSCLQGAAIKPMITQCCMRALYNAKPKNEALIKWAQENLERRRCNHHELEEPLSALECLSAVVDPKDNHTNKHRYIVASQDLKVRAAMRSISGVPLLYINKSVMIMEPMASATEDQRDRDERSKFRLGLKGQRNPVQPPKRKREDEDVSDGDDDTEVQATQAAPSQKKKKRKGPKEPNPLSMKKAKKDASAGNTSKPKSAESESSRPAPNSTEVAAADGEGAGSRKRRRKHKPKGDGDSVDVDVETAVA